MQLIELLKSQNASQCPLTIMLVYIKSSICVSVIRPIGLILTNRYLRHKFVLRQKLMLYQTKILHQGIRQGFSFGESK